MKRWLFACWLLTAPVVTAETLLDQLLAMQRRSYSQAVITSGFWEPRGVSRYRSQPGVHWGYDIAMPAGASALAAWPGKVRAIIPWAEGEWGVAVDHPDGTTATYGHLVPCVRPGDPLVPGQALGTIAVDHLDVKMRDPLGLPLDFGHRGATSPVVLPSPPIQPPAQALALQQAVRQHLKQPPISQRFASGQLRLEPQDCSQLLALKKLLSQKSAPWKLHWSQHDRQAIEQQKAQLAAVEERYALGLISRRHLEQQRSFVQLLNDLTAP